jgi:S-DNA-T family DNA segregation ATPase FtsK/SpoIIIE
MVDRIHLTSQDREIIASLRDDGLRTKVDQWTVARLALARSLQFASSPLPEVFPLLPQQRHGVELHSAQLMGEGRGESEDLSDVFRALLSVYEGVDLFGDDEAFRDVLQRHVRRGLKEMGQEWRPDSDFHQYLLQELFFERGTTTAGSSSESTGLSERLQRILGQLGIGTTLIAAVDGPRLTRFTLELHGLDDLDRLRRGLSKIAFALGLGEDSVSTSLASGERQVFLTIPRPSATWRISEWHVVKTALTSDRGRAMQLPVCLGTDILDQPFLFDLAETPHLFVGGTTGSGKSMCLHAILVSLLDGPKPPQLVLIDPKAVEFAAYRTSRRLRGGGPFTTPKEALSALEGLVEEMNLRQDRLRDLDARNIVEANARGAEMDRIVAVVDELGDLFMTMREVEIPLIRLAQKARSAGIHLVLATQRPEAATFPGMLRSNIPSRIALTVQKAAESRIILDESGAEALLMRGDMLVRLAGQVTVRAHGCRVDPSDIAAAAAL